MGLPPWLVVLAALPLGRRLGLLPWLVELARLPLALPMLPWVVVLATLPLLVLIDPLIHSGGDCTSEKWRHNDAVCSRGACLQAGSIQGCAGSCVCRKLMFCVLVA